MSGDFYSGMPDTTSRMAPYRRSIRFLVASTLLFASSLLLVTSMGLAQSSDDLENRALFADSMEDSEDPGRGAFANGDDNDDLSGDDQYQNDDVSANQAQQTPDTGGVALLPLAGSALTAGAGGFVLLRRK